MTLCYCVYTHVYGPMSGQSAYVKSLSIYLKMSNFIHLNIVNCLRQEGDKYRLHYEVEVSI